MNIEIWGCFYLAGFPSHPFHSTGGLKREVDKRDEKPNRSENDESDEAIDLKKPQSKKKRDNEKKKKRGKFRGAAKKPQKEKKKKDRVLMRETP